jgi:ATP dependent DNA ligase domain
LDRGSEPQNAMQYFALLRSELGQNLRLPQRNIDSRLTYVSRHYGRPDCASAIVSYTRVHATASARSPAGFIAPCLPINAAQPPSGVQWLREIKHDGFRIIARKDGKRVKLYSRPGNDLTYRFPAHRRGDRQAALPVLQAARSGSCNPSTSSKGRSLVMLK